MQNIKKINYGKKWEQKFKYDFAKLPNSYVLRLKDTMSKFKSVKQISDFVCYCYPYLWFMECKATKGGTFNLKKLTQYNDLLTTQNHFGISAGVVIWFYTKQRVCYVPIEELKRIKEDLKLKSISIKMIDDPNYKVYNVPGELKKFYMNCDYSFLLDLANETYNVEKE